ISIVVTACTANRDGAIAQLFDDSDGTDWAHTGRTFGEQSYSPLSQINDQNVDQLGLVWNIDLPAANSTSEPLKVGDTLYYVTGYSVLHAVDARTGEPIWDYDPKVWEKAGPKLGVGWGPR